METLISASAGCGKTTEMIRRASELIDKGIDIDRILMLTFSRKAAYEMRQRLEDILLSRAHNNSHIAAQLDRMPLSEIGTIDSFCCKIVRRYFEVCNVDAGFIMLDEGRYNLLTAQAIKKTFDEYGEKNDEMFNNLYGRLVKKRNTQNFTKIIIDLYKFLTVLPDRTRYLKNIKGRLWQSRTKEDAEILTAMGGDIDKLIEIMHVFEKNFSGLKQKECALDFNDVEHYALKALQVPEIAEEIRGSFDYIFIDEYQDNNALQEEILKLISREENLFLVGDMKQSIYGFRHSDPDIFLGRLNKKGIKEYRLNKNYRADKRILDAVNAVFSGIMTEETASIDYAGTSMLEAGKECENNEEIPPVSINLFIEKNEKTECVSKDIYSVAEADIISKQEKLPEEAEFIIGKIAELAGRKKIHDGKDCRYIDYSDIAILCRSFSERENALISAMETAGIPLSVTAKNDKDTDETNIMINLLRLINNFRQDIPLLAVMKSPLFKFTDEELYDIRLGTVSRFYYEALTDYNGKYKYKVNTFLNRLEDYRFRAKYMNVYELLVYIFDKTGYYKFIELFASDKNTESLSVFLTAYENMPESGKKITVGGKNNSVQIMSMHGSKGLEFPIVFIFNINKKFNVVDQREYLIFDKDWGIVCKTEPRKSDPEDGKNIAYLLMQEKKQARLIREEMNLLYVALTRAKSHLYITGTTTGKAYENRNGKTTYGSMLDFILAAEDKLTKICKITFDEKIKQPQIAGRADKILVRDKLTIEALKKRHEYIYPHKAAITTENKFSVSALNERKVNSIKKTASGAGTGKRETPEAGIEWHRIMQNIDFNDERCRIYPTLCIAAKSKTLREQPFLMKIPANELGVSDAPDEVIVQGIIDLIILGEQNIIVDYKYSDADENKLKSRYRTQITLYKSAAEKILNIKIHKCVIISLKSGSETEIAF